MVVPCEFGEVTERWKSEDVLGRLSEQVEQNEVKLPPPPYRSGSRWDPLGS